LFHQFVYELANLKQESLIFPQAFVPVTGKHLFFILKMGRIEYCIPE